ncbi:MAG: hypothetical protein A2847_02235 [Candidatus Sungbacteria bacterium RIFCSPHIGHO2_01_FULL_50_25]|uniref:DNA-3-methyladenine glycosylase II n=1 Tax=Candidatus Sungbacteria bacterium RIFCSPHIGHO2_01_FULL_50_25 TaxID=1802265 RepID=A0A1G2K8U2_9BACT|nr:MAG: hypothetical protein A2847_02235 [Candidatus Sungbacteria bacterium RIFCSPHIGHO2_01_FULL_50_25]
MNTLSALQYLARKDPVLKGIMKKASALRLEPDTKRSIFEALVRAIAHQQLHGRAARQILSRFLALFPETKKFPKPAMVLRIPAKKLRAVGFSRAKVKAIRDIAARAAKGKIPTKKETTQMSDEEVIAALLPLRGVGRWTAEMILIFTLGRTDVLPVDDFGIREGFRIAYKKRTQPKPKALAAYGARWAPWRSIASLYLWRVADKTKRARPS